MIKSLGGGGGSSSLADQVSNLEYNLGVNSLRDAVNGGYAYFNMVGGVGDVYTDETGVDTGNLLGGLYNPVDDYYSSVAASAASLLVQSETTNGSTTFSDTSGNGHVVAANGNAQHSTAQAKFGSSSIAFDGSGDYLSIPTDALLNVQGGDFTIDFWLRPTDLVGAQTLFQKNAASNWELFCQLNGSAIDFYMGTGGSWTASILGAGTLVTDTWQHIAIVRNGTDLRIYLDGVSVGNTTTSTTAISGTADLEISSSASLNGYIEEFRLLKGEATWTTGFTPPIAAYSLTATNMTLPSIDFSTSLASVSFARPVILWEPVDASTLNTDIILEVSRDSGTTWEAATLEADAAFSGAVIILTADEVDLTGQPAGTTATYRIRTLNEKEIRIHGAYLQWR